MFSVFLSLFLGQYILISQCVGLTLENGISIFKEEGDNICLQNVNGAYKSLDRPWSKLK